MACHFAVAVAADTVGNCRQNSTAAGRRTDNEVILIMVPDSTAVGLSGDFQLCKIEIHTLFRLEKSSLA